jgi:putative ABC transport system permease protein
MFKNYLKIAIRNFLKYKNYSLINIFGLACGMACCILILLHVQDELRFDAFHAKADRIFRVVEKRSTNEGESHVAITVPPVAPAMKNDFPEVIEAVRFFIGWRLTVKQGEGRHIVRDYFFSEPGFFNIFDFPLRQGDPQTALAAPRAIVLTETTARRFFGNENPLGKTLQLEAEDFPEFGKGDFTVTGVLRDLPRNSHLDFGMLVSLSTLDAFPELQQALQSWNPSGFGAATYVVLDRDMQRVAVEAKLADFSIKYRGPEVSASRALYLQPLRDIHFYSAHISAERNKNEGELGYVYIFEVIAAFIALIACINYMNMATARAMHRAKEVGMRKVIGADKRQLIGQFLSESLGITFVALLLALVLVELALPGFNDLADKHLALDLSTGWSVLAGLLVIALFLGFISGSYPAFYLSRFQPIMVLKGALRAGSSASRLRRGLVVAQFALSLIMIVATFVVYQQLDYVRHKQLGFNQEQLVVIDINNDDVQSNFTTLKTEFLRNNAVQSVTVSSRVPGDWKSFRQIQVVKEGVPDNESQAMSFNGVDEDFLKTYEVELVAGRNFSRELASDSAAILLNETAARMLFGEEALGKFLRVPAAKFQGQVVGVVKDFHFLSLHDQIGPLVMGLMPKSGQHSLHGIDYFTLRISTVNVPETIAFITKIHEQFDRVNPIELDFLDKWWQSLYQRDERVGKIFGASATLAILIACIGLLGLSSFMAEQRTKEIGVRKVLGASVASIIALLSHDFTKLVLVATLLASPVAYYAMQKWLQSFAYRIEIGWLIFVAAGVLTAVIALLTTSYQALKAALGNPVEALRCE